MQTVRSRSKIFQKHQIHDPVVTFSKALPLRLPTPKVLNCAGYAVSEKVSLITSSIHHNSATIRSVFLKDV